MSSDPGVAEGAGVLDGHVVVITGAGGGLGRQHALACAQAGAAVVVNDVGAASDGSGASSAPAQQTVDLILAAGGHAIANSNDISDPAGAHQVIQTAINSFGRLDVLVNNAGILRDRTLLNMSVDEWDDVLRVHLRGTFTMTQAAGRHWRDQAKAGATSAGRVINTSSGSGLFGNFGQVNYGAAKAGIANFTIVAALELARYGVTVNAIAPLAKTRMLGTVGPAPEISAGFDPLDPKHVSQFIVWLASPLSAEVSGRVFSVVGGYVGVCEGWSIGPELKVDGGLTFDTIAQAMPDLLARAAPNFPVAQSQPY
jgi:NAD(P)-dependent dehydrogenase (short-subunit alcohol dehydrogenase family)